jgi:hypothetical protein
MVPGSRAGRRACGRIAIARNREGGVMNISIESVTQIQLSAIVEEDLEDEDEDEEPFYRTLTIVTDTGAVIEIDLYAQSRDALEFFAEDDEEE